jgi:hypothetical protein
MMGLLDWTQDWKRGCARNDADGVVCVCRDGPASAALLSAMLPSLVRCRRSDRRSCERGLFSPVSAVVCAARLHLSRTHAPQAVPPFRHSREVVQWEKGRETAAALHGAAVGDVLSLPS